MSELSSIDGPHIPFVEYEKPPEGPKERLKVLQKMKIHSEYCDSGDSTLEALQEGIKTVVEKEADDYFVFLVSDANLNRYDITPREITEQMLANKVRTFLDTARCSIRSRSFFSIFFV